MRIFKWFFIPRNIFTGTLNSDIRIYIMYCTLGGECKQTQCPHRSWREKTKALMWYYSPTKTKFIPPLGPFSLKKRCVAPDFFVLISSHCSTQIWRMRYGGFRSIYFLLHAQMSRPDSQRRDTLKAFMIKYELYINVYDFQFQGTNARKVNCGCVYFAYIFKPVLFGRNL